MMYAPGERDGSGVMTVTDAIRLARPGHWIKNILVLLPVVFSLQMGNSGAWALALPAAAAFCLLSSSVYIVNDISDRDRDRMHPAKRNRPLAAGRVTASAALVEAAVFLTGGVVLAAAVRPSLAAVVGAYLLLQLGYTFLLKQWMILDVICIALGFVLRAVAGAVAIDVAISPWLVVCTFTGCLFLGFCKRCNELATFDDAPAAAQDHRKTLAGYTGKLLRRLIALAGAIAAVSFLLYASSDRTRDNIGTISLIFTLPLVIYAVFRFATLSIRGRHADPMDILAHDWPVQLTVAAWLASAACIVHWGQTLGNLLGM